MSSWLFFSCLCALIESEGVFSRHKYDNSEELGTCDALLDIVYAGQVVMY